MGRIISTSSTNTRHKHIASNTKRSEDRASAFRRLIGWHWSKTRCCDDTWKKAALIPLADLADIGLGVQKIFNPTNGQVNSNDVRGLANTLQKYLPFPFLATGRQGSR